MDFCKELIGKVYRITNDQGQVVKDITITSAVMLQERPLILLNDNLDVVTFDQAFKAIKSAAPAPAAPAKEGE